MNSFVYLLLSARDNKTYLGSTDNIVRRLREHEDGECKSTAYRRPLRLIYKEEFDSLLKARAREKYLKTRRGRKELREIFNSLNIGA
ncbi:GIY-YIG nuclease family protein [Patescibacteria group bacterium]|nr:MAG: GIY-YIG nuclease family protein [Patescibacteria group bacterium]